MRMRFCKALQGVAALACLFMGNGCNTEPTKDKAEGVNLRPQVVVMEQRPEEPLIPAPSSAEPYAAVPEQLAPAEPLEKPQKPHVKARGIYVNEYARRGQRWNDIVKLMGEADLNAVVLDVRKQPLSATYMSTEPKEDPDMKQLLQSLEEKHIYKIGRIVVFKDPELAESNKEMALHTKAGEVWRDRKGNAWVDPFKPAVWEYNIRLAKDAALTGFDEIQFDYVRFPENPKTVDQEVQFDNRDHITKAQAISSFLEKAKAELHPLGVALSADVFGLTTSSKDDMGIGQQWGDMSLQVDYISPMVYPSHYSSGMYNIPSPNDAPYKLVRSALTDALAKNDLLIQQGKPAATIRPWLQDFSAAWIKPKRTYSSIDVKEQVKAARELGIDQFLLWNPSSIYTYR